MDHRPWRRRVLSFLRAGHTAQLLAYAALGLVAAGRTLAVSLQRVRGFFDWWAWLQRHPFDLLLGVAGLAVAAFATVRLMRNRRAAYATNAGAADGEMAADVELEAKAAPDDWSDAGSSDGEVGGGHEAGDIPSDGAAAPAPEKARVSVPVPDAPRAPPSVGVRGIPVIKRRPKSPARRPVPSAARAEPPEPRPTLAIPPLLNMSAAPRRLQARLLDGPQDGDPRQLQQPRADDATVLALRITARDWGRAADAPFPDHDVAFEDGRAQVVVRVELANAAVQPLIGDYYIQAASLAAQVANGLAKGEAVMVIALPETGDSDLAQFVFHPAPGVPALLGRVTLMHAGRILQTARLEAPMQPDVGLSIIVDAAPAADPADPGKRTAFDLALRLTDGRDGLGRRLVALNPDGGVAATLTWSELEQTTQRLAGALETVLDRQSDEVALDDPLLISALIGLAGNGVLLRQALWPEDPDADAVRRVQVVGPWDMYTPLEQVYDGAAPAMDAELCPYASEALRGDGCGACPNRRSSQTVCPSRFWSLTRRIERHGVGEAGARPTAGAAPLRHGALLATHARASAFGSGEPPAGTRELADLCGLLERSSSAFRVAGDWNDWRAAIGELHPDLLLVIAHTDFENNNDLLCIGEGLTGAQKMPRAAIASDLLGESDDPRLLVLLGCGTASAEVPLGPYPEQFRRAGADMVVATAARILGADALPIARALAAKLDEPEPTDFGDLLPELRRALLLGGHPGVLGLIGYGDTDWRLGGRDVHP